MEPTLNIIGVPTRLLVDDAARNAAIDGLAESYAQTWRLKELDAFERESVLHAFRSGCRAGLTLVVAGASAAEAVVRAEV